MIVRALGYTKDCKEMNGTWPAIYVQKARVLDITEGVQEGGSLGANRGDISMYLFNTLRAGMGYADADGKWLPKKAKNGTTNVLVIQNLNAVGKNAAVITNSDADGAIVNIRPYVGAKAEYFTVRQGSNKGDIVALGDFDTEFISGTLNLADKELNAVDGTDYDLSNVWADTPMYFQNGKDSTLTKALNTFAGGEYLQLAVELSGTDVKSNSLASINEWSVASTAGQNNQGTADTIGSGDLQDIKNGPSLFGFDFEEDGDAIDETSFVLEGVDSLDDIKEGNVVYVFAGSNDKITKVVVGTEVVTGKIKMIKSSGKKVVIDGKTYKYASQELSGAKIGGGIATGKCSAGDDVELTLDGFGYIYDLDTTSNTADDYAVALEVATKMGGIGGNSEIKLLLADGSNKVFKVDSDVFADLSLPARAAELARAQAASLVNAGGTDFNPVAYGAAPLVNRVIVKYGVDSDGVIDSLEIPVQKSATNGKLAKNGYLFSEEVKKNMMILNVEDSFASDDEDDYSAVKYDNLVGEDGLNGSYVLDGTEMAALVLIDWSTTDDVYGVLTDVASLEDDKYEITMLVNGREKTFNTVEKPFMDTATGQWVTPNNAAVLKSYLYKLTFNKSGDVKQMLEATPTSQFGLPVVVAPAKQNTFGYDFVQQITVGGAAKYGDATTDDYYIDGNTFTITNANGAIADPEGTGAYAIAKNCTVYRWNTTDLEFERGTQTDLKKYLKGKVVYFVDTVDDDNNVYDIAVIQ